MQFFQAVKRRPLTFAVAGLLMLGVSSIALSKAPGPPSKIGNPRREMTSKESGASAAA